MSQVGHGLASLIGPPQVRVDDPLRLREQAQRKVELESHFVRVTRYQFDEDLFANFKIIFQEVGLGEVHSSFQILRSVFVEYDVVEIDCKLVFFVANTQVRLVQNWRIHRWIGLAYELVDLLRIFGLVEEGQYVGKAHASVGVPLIVSQYVQVFVVGFDQELVLLPRSILLAVERILQGNRSQGNKAEGIISRQFFDDELELFRCFLVATHLVKHLSLETVLTDGRPHATLARLVNPVQAAMIIATLTSQVGKAKVGVDVIGWMLLNNLLVQVVCLVKLMLLLVEARLVEQDCQAQCFIFVCTLATTEASLLLDLHFHVIAFFGL